MNTNWLDHPVNLVDPLGLKGRPRDAKGGTKDLGAIAAGKVIKHFPDDAGGVIVMRGSLEQLQRGRTHFAEGSRQMANVVRGR